MVAIGDTVTPRIGDGRLLRRPFIKGVVVNLVPRTQVLWDDGNLINLENGEQLSVITAPNEQTAQLLNKTVQVVSVAGENQRNQGIVIGAFALDGVETVLVESVLGLLFIVSTKEVRVRQ